MLPIEQFPEVPEGLEREVYNFYESTVHSNGFSRYFGSKAQAFGIGGEEADKLDNLINQLYSTYETMKAVQSHGKQVPKRGFEFNSISSAAMGVYNFTGIVRGNENSDGDFNDIVALIKRTSSEVSNLLRIYQQFEIGSEQAREAFEMQHFDIEGAEKNALSALQDKLKFEAAIYEGIKAHYGISVEVK